MPTQGYGVMQPPIETLFTWIKSEEIAISDAFWTTLLPQSMNTSVASSPYFRLYQAAQIKLNDKGFLSKDISVRELIENKSDVHHIFSKDYLRTNGISRGQYNQIANYTVAQSEINIAIGNKEPSVYFAQLFDQCKNGNGNGAKRYGNIDDLKVLRRNLCMHCIPNGIENMTVNDYQAFLAERRKLMALKIKAYFESL